MIVPARPTRSATTLLAIGIAILPALGRAGHAADRVRVGEGAILSPGALHVARGMGYLKKLNLEIETRRFEDAAAAMSSIGAADIDLALLPVNASLFNDIAKGTPMVVILDGGGNRRGFGATVINIAQTLYDEGVSSVRDFSNLKGRKFGVPGAGSVNQYNAARTLIKAKLDPAKDVEWITNVPQPELARMLGTNEVDATDLDYRFGILAQSNKWGPIVVSDDQMVPDAQVSVVVVRKEFLGKSRDAVIRFAMAYLRAVKDFNAAAINPGRHLEVVDALAQGMGANDPEPVRAIAPNWSYIADDGVPRLNSIMEMQDFWSGKYFQIVGTKVQRQQLFEPAIAREAKARLAKERPFGN
jgi:NitT/TauT family transport system substrate-binding protein